MTQNTLESALKIQKGWKFKNFPAQWKAAPLPLDPHPLETFSHIFILIKKHYVFIIKQMPKNTFKRVFFQNIFPLRGQQGGGLAVPPPPKPPPPPSTSYPRKLPQNQKLPQKFLSAPEKKSYVKPWVIYRRY